MPRKLDHMNPTKVGRPHKPDSESRHVQAIRRLLFERRMSMRDLARAMGASRQTISALMQGENVTLATLQSAADALGVDLPDLFPRTPDPEPAAKETDQSDMAEALLKLVNIIANKGK